MMSGKAKWTLATGFAGSNGLRKAGRFANGHRLQDGMPKDTLPTLSDDRPEHPAALPFIFLTLSSSEAR